MEHECLLQSKLLFDLVIPSTKWHLTSAHSTMQEQYLWLLKFYKHVIKYTQCSVAYDVHGMQVYTTSHTERFKLLILTKHDPDIQHIDNAT